MALFVSAYLKAGHQVSVLAVARAVPEGAVLHTTDLAVARISASRGILPIPVADAAAVVGRRAAVSLVPGGLLTLGDLSDAPTLPEGEAIVGVAAKSSQLPASGVVPGETVDVVLTGLPGSPAVIVGGSASSTPSSSGSVQSLLPTLAGTVLAPDVTVAGVGLQTSTNTDTTNVSLLVPLALAPVVASASAAGQVALVVVAPIR
ncbi:MAG: SAF domain-containing protein [Acidimicrobiales bacterium]